MAKNFAEAFYRGKKWKKCRESYIDARLMKDGGLCERCRKRYGYIVHHKIKLTADNINNPEISLNHKLLEYVCKICHDEEHYEDMHGKKREPYLKFDATGQLLPP